VFRYDDFTLTHDTINQVILEVFNAEKIPLVLGIVPCDKNEKFIVDTTKTIVNLLRKNIKNNKIEIALHGLTHEIGKSSNGEFGDDKTYEEQYRRIEKGKLFLDSIFQTNVVTFIPPYNYYNSITLTALKDANFKVISASLFNQIPFEEIPGIKYIPETIEPTKPISKLLNLLNTNNNITVVIMIHPYSFTNEFSINDMKDLLDNLKNKANINFYTFKDISESQNPFDSKMMKANLERNLVKNKLVSKEVLYSYNHLFFIRTLNLLINIVLSSLIYFVVLFFTTKRKNIYLFQKFILYFTLLLIVGLATWFHLLGQYKLLLFIIIIAVILSALNLLKLKRLMK